jgi:hypothetical protein
MSFYNCNYCFWSGSELRYKGKDTLPETLNIPTGQGVCPRCHAVFQGCVHPNLIDQWRATLNTARVGAILERTGI